ncbi:hypothetical protein [Streptomyces botrytidirepellens]|uniref:hypothetical protein n=1 Tax=Streptomyces botrytidirepellens TaxID=2486417 RepID=UPI0011CD4603|nr:hypothetical protein [Streptomyces botrytidirepellens]
MHTITAARHRLLRRHPAGTRRAVGGRRWLRATDYNHRRPGLYGAHGRPAPRPTGPGQHHPRMNRAALARIHD